jgi:hypothetical protein
MIGGEMIEGVYRAARDCSRLQKNLQDFGGEAMTRYLVEKKCRTRAESNMNDWLASRRGKRRRMSEERWHSLLDRDGTGSGAPSPSEIHSEGLESEVEDLSSDGEESLYDEAQQVSLNLGTSL